SDRGQPLLHLIGQDQIRVVTLKAQQGRSHGPVPTASRSQRAIQINPQRRDRAQDTGALELTSEHRSGPHRPHSMRTRRANTHSEQIENTNSHGRDPLTKLENGPADGPAGGPPRLMDGGGRKTTAGGPPTGATRRGNFIQFYNTTLRHSGRCMGPSSQRSSAASSGHFGAPLPNMPC